MKSTHELVILNLNYKNQYKKLYLGISNNDEGKNTYKKALQEIEEIKSTAASWEVFFDKTLEILRSHGINRVDH
jgi:hypothetical protein